MDSKIDQLEPEQIAFAAMNIGIHVAAFVGKIDLTAEHMESIDDLVRKVATGEETLSAYDVLVGRVQIHGVVG